MKIGTFEEHMSPEERKLWNMTREDYERIKKDLGSE